MASQRLTVSSMLDGVKFADERIKGKHADKFTLSEGIGSAGRFHRAHTRPHPGHWVKYVGRVRDESPEVLTSTASGQMRFGYRFASRRETGVCFATPDSGPSAALTFRAAGSYLQEMA